MVEQLKKYADTMRHGQDDGQMEDSKLPPPPWGGGGVLQKLL